jgi:hypothetical protein
MGSRPVTDIHSDQGGCEPYLIVMVVVRMIITVVVRMIIGMIVSVIVRMIVMVSITSIVVWMISVPVAITVHASRVAMPVSPSG